MTEKISSNPINPSDDIAHIRAILTKECELYQQKKAEIFDELNTNKRALRGSYQLLDQCLAGDMVSLDILIQLDIILERINTIIAMGLLNQVEEHALKLKYLTRLPSMFFQLHINKLKILKSLTIDGNTCLIMHVTSDIGLLTELVDLDISGCQLHHLPDSIRHLESLEVLKIHHNHISSLPEGLCELENLKELDVSHNHELKILPENIGQLKHLRKLIIAYDNFDSLPESLGELAELNEIIADHNHLQSLPGSMAKLSNLEVLDVNHNELRELPPCIKKIAGLKYVNFTHNYIKSAKS